MIFIDLIIRLTICRAVINHQNRKFVTAQKLFILAEDLTIRVSLSNDRFCRLVVQNNASQQDFIERQEAFVIPLDIL